MAGRFMGLSRDFLRSHSRFKAFRGAIILAVVFQALRRAYSESVQVGKRSSG